MAMTKDGKHKSSKFRAARYDRENASEKEPKEPKEPEGGPRAQMHAMQGKGQGNPETESAAEEHAEEAIHPGIHDEVKQVVADHGPAHTVHMTHDHEGMRSHVHSIHADGHEHHADHDGEMHHVNAHHHAAHAAGVPPEHIADGEGGEKEPEMFGEHEPEGDEESYAEPL